MYQYKIAKTQINIKTENNYLIRRMKLFSCANKYNPDILINTINSNNIEKYLKNLHGELIVQDKINWYKKTTENKGYFGIKEDENIHVVFESNENWENGKIIYCSKNNNDYVSIAEYNVFNIVGMFFRNRLIYHNGIVIHASGIINYNRGLIFTAPTGTGKSTHTRLWEKHFSESTTIINDDTPALQIMNNTVHLFGTPWSGSTEECSNMNAPLKAIFILEQAIENSVQELNKDEIISRLLPRFFLPYFSEQLMAKAMNIIESIIEKIPIYLLKCKPDEEAVKMAYDCLD